MPVQVFTVAQYRAHVAEGIPLPDGDSIQINDVAAAIKDLTDLEIGALDDNKVTLIDVADNALSLNLAQFRALGNEVKFSTEDKLVLLDSGTALDDLHSGDIQTLTDRGVGLIDSTDGNLTVEAGATMALLATNIGFDAADTVTVSDSSFKLGLMFFSAPEIMTLSNKGVDFIGSNSGTPFPLKIGAAQAKALANSNISLMPDSFVLLSDDGSDLSQLTAAQFAKLSATSLIVLDAVDDVLTLSFDQYKVLPDTGPYPPGMSLFYPNDKVTLELSVSDLLSLTDAQRASMTANGVDALTLKDTGQALATLTADQITALSSKGANLIDATDNKLSLSLAQYNALGSVKLSGDDVVTIAADGDAVLSDGLTDLTLTGSAIRGTGNSLANTIAGTTKNNILSGLGGDDFLYGGLGKDQLSGGTGKDVFVFDTKLNKSTNVDKITDFKSKDDSFYLDNKVFTKLGSGSLSTPKKFNSDMFVEGTKAKDKEDRIVYDKKTGTLYYDADGTGKSAQVKFATLSNKEKLYYHDFFVI
ncbi:Ca2+-binding RTX toxin-like protein [Microvirga lupini]|uniref:Ca2+-binding RTX toxin-like protein n=1 Tax=Microvirga lupini TaxID=420324 RepID=A0A7W4VJL8_9HYPH|nr:calcium-binding protein [Microvirga lupini]MBB3018326.1 Ca2+-binding RTX toxin-like protein [Microvirga lupini]